MFCLWADSVFAALQAFATAAHQAQNLAVVHEAAAAEVDYVFWASLSLPVAEV